MKYEDLKVGAHVKQLKNEWIIEMFNECTTHLSIVHSKYKNYYTKDKTGYYPFGTDFILSFDDFSIIKESE